MTDRLVKNGRVLNPYTGTDAVLDVRLRDRTISEIGANLSPQHGEDVLDATGCLVVPGLIDMHVHFRDPGLTYKESIQTGSEAAAAGGFVAVVCMANTKPSLDTARQIRYVYEKADEAGLIAVYPVGSISKSLLGQEPTHYEELRFAGAIAFSDDGVSCMDEEIMRLVLRQSVEPGGVPVVVHCEDPKIAHSGVMNDGDVSKELGLAGIPREAEESIIARDIRLAEETGGRLHIQHVTTRGGVALIREGKARGVNVTGEACPHHFTLTDEAIREHGSNAKMNPPLRTSDDIKGIIEGLIDGTLDAISTDHAPHHADEKALGMERAPFGIIGLELCVPLTWTQLVHTGRLSAMDAVAKMTLAPARILHLPTPTLEVGAPANLTLIDPNLELEVTPDMIRSKSHNTPFFGTRLRGWATATIHNGNVIYQRSAKGSRT